MNFDSPCLDVTDTINRPFHTGKRKCAQFSLLLQATGLGRSDAQRVGASGFGPWGGWEGHPGAQGWQAKQPWRNLAVLAFLHEDGK